MLAPEPMHNKLEELVDHVAHQRLLSIDEEMLALQVCFVAQYFANEGLIHFTQDATSGRIEIGLGPVPR